MQKLNYLLVIFLTVLCGLLQPGDCIKCWECNSKLDPRCGQGNFDPYTLDVVDCDQLERHHLQETSPSFCRKVVQSVNHQVRTVRGCGWLEEVTERAGTCYTRTGTKDVMVTFCSCTGDMCNGSVQQTFGFVTIVLAVVGNMLL